MVALDDEGNPKPHGYASVTYERDRIPHRLAGVPRTTAVRGVEQLPERS